MGYLHISNLYRDQRILLFKACFILEKIHGTSANLKYKDGELNFSSGGAKHDQFVALFNQEELKAQFGAIGQTDVTVYGEAYGGKEQGMRDTYGPDLRFIVFDVQIGDSWLTVPNMHDVATKLGLEVVPWQEIDVNVENLDFYRDAPSEVAKRRGMGENKLREGIVCRPLIELTTNNGERLIVKHKGEAFSERIHTPKVRPDKLEVITAAKAIADEWVTPMRLLHILDKNPATDMKDIPMLIKAMIEDVYREGSGEIVESKEASAAIGSKTAQLFKKHLQDSIGK